MAAKLKKRALAEYQTQVEAAPAAGKRLRLRAERSESGAREEEPQSLLTVTADTSDQELVRHLVTFAAGVEGQGGEVLGQALRKVMEMLGRVEDACVRVRLVDTWSRILATGRLEDGMARLEEAVAAIQEASSKVTAAWLAGLTLVAAKLCPGRAARIKLFRVGEELLQATPHPLVHCKALQLLSTLAEAGEGTESRQMAATTLALCGAYSMAQDARVRTAAFHALLTIHKRGVRLDVSMYPVFCTALTDDYEGVRCEALKLISALAATEPEFQVEVEGDSTGETKRLVDDVFSRTCQAINDVREGVRCLAARMIGGMAGVSPVFLAQTLDKKLMSNMRVKRSAHERMNTLISSGEWSSGQKWADDAPKEHLQAEQVNLVALGSCGAFVHGLEDECLSVRSASVEALTKLAIGNQELAMIALDFLVDMFNDEIEQVRLKAIESLTAIARHIQLQHHQLEVILGALDDFSTLLRERLHLMLQACTISTKDGLENVIQKLKTNLKRYPQDRRSILVTFKHLGSNHPALTLPLVTSLLEIHPYFDKQEPDIEDPSYLCTLVLVLNAAEHCPTLPQLLDSHTRQHHSYLQDTFPHLIPSSHPSLLVKPSGPHTAQTAAFLQAVLARVVASAAAPPARRLSVLQTSVSELARLASIEPSLLDPSSFARAYMEGQTLFLRVVGASGWAGPNLGSAATGQVVTNHILSLHATARKLHAMFSNIGEQNSFLIRMFKLKVAAVNLVFTVCGSNKSALGQTDAFIREFEDITRDMAEAEVSAEPFLVGVHTILTTPDAKPGFIARKLKPLLIQHPPAGLAAVAAETAMARAVIHAPTGGQETPLKYMAGLVLGIPMDAEVLNVTDRSALRICIFTMDQQSHLSLPRVGDLTPSAGGGLRLLTTALLSHQVWTEPLDVEISLVLDLGEEGKREGRGRSESIVHICKPVKVSVLPKRVNKGF